MLLLVLSLLLVVLLRSKRPVKRTIAIIVLGDIGRSPRVMYHAQSFSNISFSTFIIGYSGSTELPSLHQPHSNISFFYLNSIPSSLSSLPFLLSAPLKLVHQ